MSLLDSSSALLKCIIKFGVTSDLGNQGVVRESNACHRNQGEIREFKTCLEKSGYFVICTLSN